MKILFYPLPQAFQIISQKLPPPPTPKKKKNFWLSLFLMNFVLYNQITDQVSSTLREGVGGGEANIVHKTM